MKSDLSLSAVISFISWFLKRFHVVIFVVIVFGSLAAAVLILSSIVQSSTDTSNQDPTRLNTSFDQDTINRIEELRTRDDNQGTAPLPDGRINPFVE